MKYFFLFYKKNIFYAHVMRTFEEFSESIRTTKISKINYNFKLFVNIKKRVDAVAKIVTGYFRIFFFKV
jgi:hypothetical protein